MTGNETYGVLAAITAPFFMALGFIIWDVTWKASGGSAFALNMFKCNLATIGFLFMSFVFGWEIDIEEVSDQNTVFSIQSVSFLVLSGFIGIIIGDLAWLEALRLLGATQVLVIDSIKPFTAALMGWLILDESINNIGYSGIVLTVLGIFVVSFERERIDKRLIDEFGEQKVNGVSLSNTLSCPKEKKPQEETTQSPPSRVDRLWNLKGYIFAIGNVILDTYGSILTKQHGGGMSTWSINLIRFGSAGIIMGLISLTSYVVNSTCNKRRTITSSVTNESRVWYLLPSMNVISWLKICIGVVLVTFLCPALSNYALFQISLAFALTLGSISPLYGLILEWPLKGIKPSFRCIIGACAAIGGVVILSIIRNKE